MAYWAWREKFQELSKLLAAKFPALVESFIAGAEAKLKELDQAARIGDSKTLHHVAHALKGISANIGAMRLYELASEFDQRAQQGNTEGAVERVAIMADVFVKSSDWLRQRCKTPASKETA